MIVAAAYLVQLARVMPYYGTDFDPIRFGATLLREGRDPYALIGPGRQYVWNFRLLYPMPALLLGLPFTVLPLIAARAAFAAILSGAAAWAVTRESWRGLVVFASASWWSAVGLAQWSPGVLAAATIPWLGVVLAAKPNIGIAILAAARSRRQAAILIGTAGALTLAAFIVAPHWLRAWREAIRDQPHIRPLAASWLGAPLCLAAIRWRDPRARLLLALAFVPMNPAPYEGVLLFTIPQSAIGAVALALGSWFVEPLASAFGRGFGAIGDAMVVCMFLPALVLIFAPLTSSGNRIARRAAAAADGRRDDHRPSW